MSQDDGVDRLFSYWAAFYHKEMKCAIRFYEKSTFLLSTAVWLERVMGLEPTISCLGSKRSTTELHPQNG